MIEIEAKKEWLCAMFGRGKQGTCHTQWHCFGEGWWQNWAWGCKNWPVGTRVGDMVTDWIKSSLDSFPHVMKQPWMWLGIGVHSPVHSLTCANLASKVLVSESSQQHG